MSNYIVIVFFVICFFNLFCNSVSKKQNDLISCGQNTGIKSADDILNGIVVRKDTSNINMQFVSGAAFYMGAMENEGYPEEYPRHKVAVDDFFIDFTEVTNSEFELFVKATNYVTTAEKKAEWEWLKLQLPDGTPKPHDSLLQAGGLVFTPTKNVVPLNNANCWWRFVAGANWKHPNGPESNIIGKGNYPVVQVSWLDAMAFCKWARKRLPTEAEWEWAAKAGNENAIYAWGEQHLTNNFLPTNIWQGTFPYNNLLLDSFYLTAPAKSFVPNALGLYNMSGNVWEWCADWMDANYYKTFKNAITKSPCGPTNGYTSTHPAQKILKGGSFLCNESYCTGYRVARRNSASWETSSNHIGFRCAR